MIGPTISHISSRLPHDSLGHVGSLTEADISEGSMSATALPEFTFVSMAQETDGGSSGDSRGGPRGGDESFAGPPAVTTDTATLPFVTANKGLSFAVDNVQTSQEVKNTSPVPISYDLVRLSPADLAHAKSGAFAHSDEPAKGGTNDGYVLGFSNSTTQHSPPHTRLSHGASNGKTSMTTEHEGQMLSSTLLSTCAETGTRTPSSSSTTKTSTPGLHGAAMDGSNFSRRLSQRGIALVLGSVLGGSFTFFGIVLLHRLGLRFFRRSGQGSTMYRGPLSMDDPCRKKAPTNSPEVASISHFSVSS
ncbi:hypothetical protein N7490_001984 [Penicillium lividum]|nr:hypothetical protein N7490_001984 [Penicillium lividum]